jgi:hypothetical protein
MQKLFLKIHVRSSNFFKKKELKKTKKNEARCCRPGNSGRASDL